MSYDYKLAGNKFNRQQWNQKAADYFNSKGDQFVPITWNGGMPVTDPGDLSGSDLDGTQCWALPEGGIRGVGISPDEDCVDFVLATLASRADFSLVEDLLKLGSECGGEPKTEEGEIIVFGENGPSQGFETWWNFGRSSLKGIFDQEDGSGEATLPVGGYGLKVTAADIELSDDDLEQKFINLSAKYGSAFLASVMVIEMEGRQAKVVVYSDRETLISKDIDGVAIYGSEENNVPNIVPLASFLESMGDLAEESGSSWFLAPVGFLEDNSKYERFQALPELTPEGLPETEALIEFDADTMEYFNKLPIYVFFFVAGADGNVDKKETEMFFALLQNSDGAPSPTFAKSAQNILVDVQSLLADVVENDLPMLPIKMAMAKGVIETSLANPEENYLYKLCLLTLAKEIAEASGGFLGFGSKISKSERQSIESLKQLLEMPDFEF